MTFVNAESTVDRHAVSTFRLYLMRVLYLLILVALGSDVWPGLIHPKSLLAPLEGVAYSFWGALSLLGALGLRYPLKMVPVLILQLVYKTIWLATVAYPLWLTGEFQTAEGMAKIFAVGLVIDLIVIPWPYVFANYVRARGDRWR